MIERTFFILNTSNSNFSYISLFSGIGGFEIALNNLGGTCLLSSEIDVQANRSYEILYGEPTAGDITAIHERDVPSHEMLVGGFPCQAFSVAGHRKGFEDARGTLFFEIARIAKEKQPPVMILENVKGLVSHNKGETLATLCAVLTDIGYAVDFNIMNSKYFNVPQNRERIFFVCVRRDLVTAEQWHTLPKGTSLAREKNKLREQEILQFNFNWPPQEKIAVHYNDIIHKEQQEFSHYLREYMAQEIVEKLNDKHEWLEGVHGINYTKDGCGYAVTRSTHALYAYRSAILKHNAVLISEFYPFEKVTQELLDFAKLPIQLSELLDENKRRIADGLIDGLGTSYDEQAKALVIYGKGLLFIRRSTPKENLTLQGFPEDTYQKLFDGGMKPTNIFKQAGNAVTVNVVQSIAKNLLPYIPQNTNMEATLPVTSSNVDDDATLSL